MYKPTLHTNPDARLYKCGEIAIAPKPCTKQAIVRCAMFACIFSLIVGCASKGGYVLNLMPSPDIFEEGSISPFIDSDEKMEKPAHTMLYATDRRPSKKGAREKYYRSERGALLRLGEARIELGHEDMTWEEARRVSLLKNRPGKYPLAIAGITEFGVLNRTLTMFDDPEITPDDPIPAKEFSDAINKKLTTSRSKDIFIYVHGYKVTFENPVLVASELWHFMGYQGAFVAYSWPSTPKKTAYFADLETARYSARNFRIFLQYLAEETDARRIHIVGYSAGTRMVLRTLEQLALMNVGSTKEEIGRRLRIGNVCLLGSDVDREMVATYLVDGLLKIPTTLSFYQSDHDKALGMSRWVMANERMGQASGKKPLSSSAQDFLRIAKDLNVISVTDAAGADSGNGHGYFRKSPWVSSDVLMTLMYGLSPEERGLVRIEDSHIWTFPKDYIQRLRAALTKAYTP